MNKSSFFIVGQHAVIEALRNPKRKVLRVFLTEESKKNIHRKNPNKNILEDVKVYFKSKKELDKYTSKEQLMHNGYVAEIEHLDKPELKEYIKEKNNLTFVCLDEVTDPRNIGSIIRTAVSFNIDGIIVKERSFPLKSKLLYKSASGGVENINIFKVSNINMALKFLKTRKFWISAFDVTANKDFTSHDWNGKNVLLFGSEGFGLRKKTLSNADFSFRININKSIESLNISNSVSVVCHYINNFIKK